MKQDKALQKLLSGSKPEELSFGFKQKAMNHIFVVAEKKSRRKYALSMVLVSLVSLAIIAGAVYVLNLYYTLSFSLTFPRLNYSDETKSIILFSFYISSIVLFLLGLDSYLRRLKKKME